MNDLERHAIRWRLRGLPRVSYPDGDGEVFLDGLLDEPEWHLETMSPDEFEQFGAAYFAFLKERDQRRPGMTDAEAYGICCSENGIACPHPPHYRVPRLTGSGRVASGYECSACQSWVVPAPLTWRYVDPLNVQPFYGEGGELVAVRERVADRGNDPR